MTLQNAVILNQFIYPASHVANPGNTNTNVMPPMGARFRLKANVDITQLNPQSRIIAQAMKDYGLIVADNGSNFFFSGASASMNGSNQETLTWDDNDIQDSVRGLKSLQYNMFEVVDLTPRVTSLSTTSGVAGTSVTIVGQNFSGSAGRLQVLFGNTAATSMTYVSDTQIVAIAPVGTGTVDVRVQSGVASSTSQNIKNPIFGYGISAVSAASKFTFGVTPPPNQAPTVAQAAAASTVVSMASTLSVLGADDGGEGNLTYTWSSVGPATGSATFSTNGTNAAKSSVATFTQSGTYTLTVTITDAQGLSVTSSVLVTVPTAPPPNAPPTVAVAAAASTPVAGKSNLSVLGADDAGEASLRYTWTSTGPAAVTFSVNGTNAAKSTVATFTKSGTYTLTARIVDAAGLSVTSSVDLVVKVNQKPTVSRKAIAAPFVLVGNSTRVSAIGADDGGGANLTYTWSSIGPKPVTFSHNGSYAAWNVGVTFSSIGSYLFTVTITDQEGQSVKSSVYVVVLPDYAYFWPVYWQVVAINSKLQ
jgi:hypothetical protein